MKRPDAKTGITWHIAMGPGKRKVLNKDKEADALIDQAESLNAGIRAKVEYPFRVIKRQFGFVKVRYRGLKKNTAQIITLFALSNLWMVRAKLMAVQGRVRPKRSKCYRKVCVKSQYLKIDGQLLQFEVRCSDHP